MPNNKEISVENVENTILDILRNLSVYILSSIKLTEWELILSPRPGTWDHPTIASVSRHQPDMWGMFDDVQNGEYNIQSLLLVESTRKTLCAMININMHLNKVFSLCLF